MECGVVIELSPIIQNCIQNYQKIHTAFISINSMRELPSVDFEASRVQATRASNLPQCFGILRRRLEADHGSDGSKEYIAVLRLLENHPLARLKVAVNAALELGCTRRELIER